jgi:segregation and condensation protein A
MSALPETSVASIFPATSTEVPREAAEKMLNYLVFHRSLLGETEDSTQLLERYLTLVRELKDGVHVVITDPFQKATALLLELVLDEEFDPWEIDLVKFTDAYLERVRADGSVNFAVAGRLLYMAWSILYLQSEELLKTREPPPEPVADGELPSEGLDDGYLGMMDTPEAVDVTSSVLGSVDPPALVGMVRHPETRPVSLLELVRAFGEAEQDARQAVRVQELRDRLRDEQRAPPEVLVHGDIPAEDLEDAWEIARSRPSGSPFALLDLWTPLQGRDRLVSLFLALLFLAREGAVELDQAKVGEGPVMIVRIREERVPIAEE